MARYSNEDEGPVAGICMLCKHADPDVRSQHQMSLAREFSIEAVRAHLVSNGVRAAHAEDCTRWLTHLIVQYTNIPDPHTGETLPWWEARLQLWQQRDQIANHCYAEAPAEYRIRYEGRPPAEVPGFTHIRAEEGTPFPEEAPYVPPPSERQWYEDPEAWEDKEPGWNDGP